MSDKKHKEEYEKCTNDKMYKAIFGSESDNYMICELLTRLRKMKIKNIRILNNELTVRNINDRKKIVDLLVKDVDRNTLYLLELNASVYPFLHQRNFDYDCRIYSIQTKSGKKYDTSLEYIHIDLTYGTKKLYENNDKEVYIHTINDGEWNTYVEKYKIYEYNMDKIKNYWYTNNKKKIEEYRHLIMLDLNKEELAKLADMYKEDEFIMRFKKEVDYLNNNDFGLKSAEEDLEYCLNTQKDIYEKEIEEVRNSSREETLTETARNLLKNNVDIGIISRCTNLPTSQIMNLR